MIVMKFGGSSVDSPESIQRVVGIIRGQLHRQPVVVVSAMAKTTRRLLESADAAAAGDLDLPTAWAIFEELRDFHEQRGARAVVPPAGHAVLETMLDRYFGELRALLGRIATAGKVTPRSPTPWPASASWCRAPSCRSRSTARRAWRPPGSTAGRSSSPTTPSPAPSRSTRRPIAALRAALLPHLRAGRVPVLGGYVGSTRDGVTTTLGKEGSDFSAAIVGAALEAEEVQIWTDVEGMLTADPRCVPGARRIRTLSFDEALELRVLGGQKAALRHAGAGQPRGRADPHPQLVAPPSRQHPRRRHRRGHPDRPARQRRRAGHQVDRLAAEQQPPLGLANARGGGLPLPRLRGLRALPARAAGARRLGARGRARRGPRRPAV